MKYETTASVHGELIGLQVVMISPGLVDKHEEIRTTISHQVINTGNKCIRHALIELGWTPPPGSAAK